MDMAQYTVHTMLRERRQELDTLKARNAKLLEALENIVKFAEAPPTMENLIQGHELVEAAIEAIREAKEQS